MQNTFNRSQKRQQQREVEKTMNEIKCLSPRALSAIKEALKCEVEREFIPVMHCMYATALYADYGFSTTRINRTIEAVNKQFIGVSNKSIDAKTQILDWCIDKKIDFVLEVKEVADDAKAI